MITIDTKTKEISRGPNYWVMKHFTHAAHQVPKWSIPAATSKR